MFSKIKSFIVEVLSEAVKIGVCKALVESMTVEEPSSISSKRIFEEPYDEQAKAYRLALERERAQRKQKLQAFFDRYS